MAGAVYKPLLIRYLSSLRIYEKRGLCLEIAPGVFHPKFFYSTRLLLQYVSHLSLSGKTMLELGAGSGLISFAAAQSGARVTATDINPVAVEYLQKNMEANHLHIQVLLSDMFKSIRLQRFDIVAINPPYYQKNPRSFEEYAWYCGENCEYYRELFSELKAFVHENSIICMVVCEGCNLPLINNLAFQNGWNMNYVSKKKDLLENSFIVKVEPMIPSQITRYGSHSSPLLFEDVYLSVRKAEHRIYSDQEIKDLPQIAIQNPYYKEWLVRAASARKLIRYLQKKKRPLNILEIGSGNGWLSNALADIPESQVCGAEINTCEFRQSERVFGQKSNLKFIQADFNEIKECRKRYDIIVMAASLQYFPSAKNFLEKIRLHFLKPGGEIHIMDTPFYIEEELDEAGERTKQYYRQLGFPEMIPRYFHHSFSELKTFHYRFMGNIKFHHVPLLKRSHSFYWIRIKNIQNDFIKTL